jgi:HEAT repeat protein
LTGWPRNPGTNSITHSPLKHTLRELLDQGRLEQITELALRRKRVLASLVASTYDADPRISWRAIEAVGLAASRIADDDPDHVREFLRQLLWLMNDESGAICWRAPEALAEILWHRPILFADYIPIVTSLIMNLEQEDLEHFRAGTLRAIGRLGAVGGDHVRDVLPSVTSALNDSDPQVRGMAVWCLREVGRVDLLADRPDLLADEEPVDLYEGGMISRTTVSQLVQRALSAGPAQR